MTEQAADTRDFEAGDVPELNRWALAVRRTLDLVIGLVVLVLLIVPSLIIIVLVVVTSRGPILFTQKRVGKNGRTFNVLKFRTMQAGTHTAIITDDAELARYQDNGFKVQPDDPRITSVGRVLRKSSLDEIPQLVNVFWGDMSIVGIRPLLPEELALRSERDQMLYRMLRPGMTGLWQVEGRSHVEQVDRVGLDRTYIESWSIGSDLWIMLRTPFALLKVGNTH